MNYFCIKQIIFNLMTYDELATILVSELEPLYGERESRAIQRYIFTSLEGIDTGKWLLKRHEIVDNELVLKVKSFLPKLLDHVPVQYVVGKAFSNDLEFVVTPEVLIPRPETEQLVTLIIENISKNRTCSILDIGTGSGVIAISLAKFLPYSKVTAMDVSVKALEIAAINALSNKVNIEFLKDDILDPKEKFVDKFDVIVSNPPYVKDSEAEQMHQNVLKHEPHLALFVRDNEPLVFYNAIIDFAKDNINNQGILWFEINENEGDNMKRLLEAKGFQEVEVIYDFNSRPRFIKAIWYE